MFKTKEQTTPFNADEHLMGWHDRSIHLMNLYSENPHMLSKITNNMMRELNRLTPNLTGKDLKHAWEMQSAWRLLQINYSESNYF